MEPSEKKKKERNIVQGNRINTWMNEHSVTFLIRANQTPDISDKYGKINDHLSKDLPH